MLSVTVQTMRIARLFGTCCAFQRLVPLTTLVAHSNSHSMQLILPRKLTMHLMCGSDVPSFERPISVSSEGHWLLRSLCMENPSNTASRTMTACGSPRSRWVALPLGWTDTCWSTRSVDIHRSESERISTYLTFGDAPNLDRSRSWIKRAILELFRNRREFHFCEFKFVPLYPTSQQHIINA